MRLIKFSNLSKGYLNFTVLCVISSLLMIACERKNIPNEIPTKLDVPLNGNLEASRPYTLKNVKLLTVTFDGNVINYNGDNRYSIVFPPNSRFVLLKNLDTNITTAYASDKVKLQWMSLNQPNKSKD